MNTYRIHLSNGTVVTAYGNNVYFDERGRTCTVSEGAPSHRQVASFGNVDGYVADYPACEPQPSSDVPF